TNYIIDPFDTFAKHLATALQSPGLYLLQRWLTSKPDSVLGEPLFPPTSGHWVVCGYGRFGKAVFDRLMKEEMSITVVEETPEKTGEPAQGVVVGRGTEAETLLEAGIQEAVGIVAGTDNDANNLSIVMTAKALNTRLFVIARQNYRENDPLFHNIGADMVMHPSTIIAEKIRVLLATPLLYEFMSLAAYQSEEWACALVSRIAGLVHQRVPEIQEILLEKGEHCAISEALARGQQIRLGDLMRDPTDRNRTLTCIALLHVTRNNRTLMPEADTLLDLGDKLLFCGTGPAFARMQWTLCHAATLDFVMTGVEKPRGWLWRRLSKQASQ
ncbi:MAG TPA: potassium transporter TrkA, partial [Chromatiaceae bacterium]|nr:potassium transporter TrkA [Chromatiaceae bacterium]